MPSKSETTEEISPTGESITKQIETSVEINDVSVSTRNHTTYSTIITAHLPENGNTITGNYRYSAKYGTFIIEELNEVTLTICSTNNTSSILDAEVVETESIFPDTGKRQIILPANECRDVIFSVRPKRSGDVELIFNIYDGDSYYKELKQNIVVFK